MKKTGEEVLFSFLERGINVRIMFYPDGIVRVVKTRAGEAPALYGRSVKAAPVGTDAVKVSESGSGTSLSDGSGIAVCVGGCGEVSFRDGSGRVLLAEKRGGVSFVRERRPGGTIVRVRQEFETVSGASLWGLGQHQSGVLNQRGERVLLSQVNKEIAVPFAVSSDGFGIFWNNPSPTVFEDSEYGTAFESESGKCADYFFIPGSGAVRAAAGMQKLTGGVGLPPLWMFGYIQSRERYTSRYELLSVAGRYRDLGVPLDCVVQDWKYWGTEFELWNSMEFLNPAFKGMAETVRELHEMNVRVLISVWPCFGDKTAAAREMGEKGFLLPFDVGFGDGHLITYDAWNPDARAFYWELLNREILPSGVDGLWMDASEPEQVFPRTQEVFPGPDASDMPTFCGTFRTERNAYPLEHVEGVAERLRGECGRRPCILTRSAYAGMQRTGAFCWSGDIESTWATLKRQIPAGINFSMSGLPFWNTDIGGFFSDREYPGGSSEPGYAELYVRWIQFGAFCPMMRSHGTASPHEIWQFGEKGDWAYDAIESSIRLRYRLLPYIYSAAGGIMRRGGALMAPVEGCSPVPDDEFMFGESLLVAPVLEPMYVKDGRVGFSPAGVRKVALPSGTWYDFFTECAVDGGRTVSREAPIGEIPVYVKAGSVIVFGPDAAYSSEKPWDSLDVTVYPGENGMTAFYEDAFDGLGYERGEYSEIRFEWNDASRTLCIRSRNGAFPGMHARRVFNVRLAGSERTECVEYLGDEIYVRM